MKILIVEPFFTGSHKQWAESYQQFSQHHVDILSLTGRHWKWRMHGAALTLAEDYMKNYGNYDLILATDMLDLAAFMALSRKKLGNTPVALYFHENQLTYPWSPTDQDLDLKRDNHYAFINYSSAMVADEVFFNSGYHLSSFVGKLPDFLKQFPDHNGLHNVEILKDKSRILNLGMDFTGLEAQESAKKEDLPVILWNHRWEYDKNPESFFRLLLRLKNEGLAFKLVVLGASFKKCPKIFKEAKSIFEEEILHFGYCEDLKTYYNWLRKSDIMPVTSNQDFFGGAVVEAIFADVFPILPNRLAYPEHIPIEKHGTHLYDNEEELYRMTAGAILNVKEIRNGTRQYFVTKYTWTTLAPKYDLIFSHISQTK